MSVAVVVLQRVDHALVARSDEDGAARSERQRTRSRNRVRVEGDPETLRNPEAIDGRRRIGGDGRSGETEESQHGVML